MGYVLSFKTLLQKRHYNLEPHIMATPFSGINIIDLDQEHMLGRVHSMVAGSVVDGPGIRHTIFLQGCQFKCLYCHNRDTWDLHTGQLFKVSELVDEVLSYAAFMDKSRGGVTVTGGEPMLQAQFVGLLFKQLHKMGINTCLDTNGYASKHIYGEVLDSLLENTDLVMLDIKQMDNEKHKLLVDNRKGRSLADPWLIASAMDQEATVVTKESLITQSNAKTIKIPNVCNNMGVRCIDDFEFVKELGFLFSCVRE